MDPVSIPRLLDALEVINQRPDRGLQKTMLTLIDPRPKRAAEILRVLREIGLVYPQSEEYRLTSDFTRFLEYWESRDLDGLNEIFKNYRPYAFFLKALEKEPLVIPVKPTHGKTLNVEKKAIADKLSELAQFKLTYVAFDTLRYWGMVLDKLYTTCFSERKTVYWAGAHPLEDEFKQVLKEVWQTTKSFDGYASLPQVAEGSCVRLKIGFLQFEKLLFDFLRNHPGAVYVSSSALRPIEKRNEVQVLRKRTDALTLNQLHPGESRWIAKRYLEDGIVIGNRYMRFITWRDNL